MNFKERIINPSKNQKLEQDDYFTWGASVLGGEDGKYYMFVARWKKEYNFRGWLTKSEIVRAVSDRKEGPFVIQDVLTSLMEQEWSEKMVHNPTIKKIGDKYYLYYIGTNYPDDVPMVPDEFGGANDVIWHPARYNQKIGVAIADSLDGAFIPSNKNPILDKREGEWDCTFVNNPSIFCDEDDTIKMIYKSRLVDKEVLILGAASATHPEGPFERVGPSPLFDYDIEDPYIWKENGMYYMLAKDMCGDIVGKYDGILFESKEGLNYVVSENRLAYNHYIAFTDGEEENAHFVERPQLLIEDGRPVCLYQAVKSTLEGNHSYNLARLLR